METYTKISLLGKGGYGVVYKSINNTNNKVVALKIIENPQLDVNNEIQILKLLSNPCNPSLACYYNSFIDNNKLYIETEYIDGIDLLTFHKKQKNTSHLIAILKDL